MSIELKPCPHCGNERVWVEDIEIRGMSRYYAICMSCGAKSGNEETPENATKKWNARTERMCENLEQPDEVNDAPFHCSVCGARATYDDGTYHVIECYVVDGMICFTDSWDEYDSAGRRWRKTKITPFVLR